MYISVCAVSCNYMHLQFQIQLYHIFHVQCESRYVRGVLAPRKTIMVAEPNDPVASGLLVRALGVGGESR